MTRPRPTSSRPRPDEVVETAERLRPVHLVPRPVGGRTGTRSQRPTRNPKVSAHALDLVPAVGTESAPAPVVAVRCIHGLPPDVCPRCGRQLPAPEDDLEEAA